MQIREATIADLAKIRSLAECSPEAAHWSAGQYEELLEAGAPKRLIYVTSSGNNSALQGFVIARLVGDECEIENVVVEEGCRRMGVGSALIGRVREEAMTFGSAAILLEVRESNVPARRLYERTGFTAEGSRRDYYRNPTEAAILYRLRLQFYDKIC